MSSFLRSKQLPATAAATSAPVEFMPMPPQSSEPSSSWKVDEALLEETSRLVPASPDDVSEETRAVLYAMVFQDPEAWVNLDHAEFGLGVALDLFPQEATFETLKWIFWTDNALHKKLSNLVQALARPDSECLESRTQPDFQFRRAPAVESSF